MEHFFSLLKNIAKRIAETEGRRGKLADFVKEISPQTQLTQKVTPSPLKSIKIAAVDGGIVKKSLHGMDCLLVRAAAVCFSYKEGKVEKVSYYPSRNPPARPEMYESLSELDWNHFSSLSRMREEVTTATQCLDVFSPDLLLLDGMVLPHYLDRPSRASPLYKSYQSLLQSYSLLFNKALEKNICLAGVIEDSRNTVFCDYLEKEVFSRITHPLANEMISLLKNTRDTNLLYLILQKGERSHAFTVDHDLPDLTVPPIKSFYLKTAKFDRPLKVDFLVQTGNVETLASTLLAISGHHSTYGIPAPIIEADNVAKLSESEIENFYSQLLSLTGRMSSTLRLRRDQRPF